MSGGIKAPFGEADCDSEVRILKSEYSEVYFEETPFNTSAIKPETYLIIGRRGSGKTALAQYFSFQKTLHNPTYIAVDEPGVYQKVLSDIAVRASESREIAIPRLKRIWEYVLWRVIFEHVRTQSAIVEEACWDVGLFGSVSNLINSTIDRLIESLLDPNEGVIDKRIEELLSDRQMAAAQAEALKLAHENPIIIALDTLEKYDISDPALMNAMAALVQCAAEFNLEFSGEGIHLKIFMSGEVFPYLEEDVLQNPSKSLKNPVYLFWRPKDLLRMISWRFHRYLDSHQLLKEESKGTIDWTNHRQVFDKMWTPYFGLDITNIRESRERTFPYVLRHTQMRPRQLILLCNSIADQALGRGFPQFCEKDIKLGVKSAETRLAVEIINSFSEVYPKVSFIVDALMKMPMLFTGNQLDIRARQSASEWPSGTYSPARFRRLVAELGIVGRVRRHNEQSGYIDADFEYSLRERLSLTHRDECVMHPMFYTRFNVEFNTKSRVMPFSTEREDRDENDSF